MLALTIALVIFVVALTWPQTAWAHGGGTLQVANEPVGPYLVSIWTNPDPAVVGEMHVTVGVSQADTGDAVTEAEVQVSAGHNSGSPSQTVIAGHEEAITPIFYEADLGFSSTGVWQLRVDVQGAEGSGSTEFSLDVQEAAPNWLFVGLTGVVAVIILWLAWMLLRGGNKKTRGRKTKGR